MAGAPNGLRISWHFPSVSLARQNLYDNSGHRPFAAEKLYFDHYNIQVSEVRAVMVTMMSFRELLQE